VDVKTPWLQEQQAGSPATTTAIDQQPKWTKIVQSHMAKKNRHSGPTMDNSNMEQ
jgi:hypothetical protein